MSWFPYRVIARIGILTIAAAASLHAQEVIENVHDHAAPAACGMATMTLTDTDYQQALRNTLAKDPAFYNRRMAAAKQGEDNRRLMSSGTGVEWEFSMFDRALNQWISVYATLVYDGELARIWTDNRDLDRLGETSTAVVAIARALDSQTGNLSRNPQQGIIENNIEVFGPTPKAMEMDGKTDFLLTDIKDNLTGGYVAGYFYPFDQTNEAMSNQMNLLYIDSKQGVSGSNLTATLGTVAHEFQHLIHYGGNKSSDIVFNEGCSEVASILNGYLDRTNPLYLSNTNVDMFSWPSGSTNGQLILANYQRGMTFMHYLTEQYGESFLKQFVKATRDRMQRIADAQVALGKDPDWNTPFKNYAVANYLLTNPNPLYSFKQRVTQFASSKPALAKSYTAGQFKAADTLLLQRYGLAYVQYVKPEGLQVRFDGSGEYRVMAISYRGNNIDVIEMRNHVDYTLGVADGQSTAPDKVVLAFVNMNSGVNDIQWSAQRITLGIEDEVAGAATFGIAEVAPNPIVGSATISFTTTDAAPVTLAVYNGVGEIVGTLVDGRSMEAGTHEARFDAQGLPSGYYYARLTQGEKSITRVLMVTK